MAAIIVHFASVKQVELLAEVFAKPEERNSELVWVMPKWWDVMYEAAGATYGNQRVSFGSKS